MKRRNREFSIFSMSALDLFASATSFSGPDGAEGIR